MALPFRRLGRSSLAPGLPEAPHPQRRRRLGAQALRPCARRNHRPSIAAIIVGHALAGYSDLGDAWPYRTVRETTLSAPTVAVVLALVVPFVMFLMALLFLVAGLLAPASLARKGPARFARDRLLRLGVPFAVFTLLLWPALEYGLFRVTGSASGSFRAAWVSLFPTSGPLWFVGLLLLLSLTYAGWRALRPDGVPGTRPIPLRALGIAAAGRGWLTAVPERVSRASRAFTVLGVVVLAALILLPAWFPRTDLIGGRHWQALVFDLVEGVLTVFSSIWWLSIAQRRRVPLLRRVL